MERLEGHHGPGLRGDFRSSAAAVAASFLRTASEKRVIYCRGRNSYQQCAEVWFSICHNHTRGLQDRTSGSLLGPVLLACLM